MTVGYEGVGPKKPRIQLKIAPSSEGKEGTSPVQGTSDSMSGQGKKGQAKTIIKVKRKVTTEDGLATEKRRKATEEPPSRVQPSADDSAQVVVGTAMQFPKIAFSGYKRHQKQALKYPRASLALFRGQNGSRQQSLCNTWYVSATLGQLIDAIY